MTLVGIVTDLSERFLRERTFELIVAPAIADVQFNGAGARGIHHARNCAALLSAFAWGVYEDLTNDSGALTFAALTFIPACYYTFLIVVFLKDVRVMASPGAQVVVAAAVGVLSLGPAIACYWPERPERGPSGRAPVYGTPSTDA